jgi:oligopeptide/dipeptide ABC transporter ATP-binding protein
MITDIEDTKTGKTVLEVKNLKTRFKTPDGTAKAVNGISFRLQRGETFALVGESGCGKSVTASSIMQILQQPAGSIEDGQIIWNNRDITKLDESEKRRIRGNIISMVFQEPQNSLNPVFTIGNQIAEVFKVHRNMRRKEIRRECIRLLDKVGIPDPEETLGKYPHQLSGGMKQRVMIAMAVACHPDVLIADEPTTALDVTIQAQVLALMEELRRELNTAILLITHDLGVVREVADRVAVMYTGRIVESADCEEIFTHPLHPYTRKLLQCVPSSKHADKRLSVIPGHVPSALQIPEGCTFADRCFASQEDCKTSPPPLIEIFPGHKVACYHWQTEEKQSETPLLHKVRKEKEQIHLCTEDLKVYYPIQKGLFRRTVGYVRAVDGVSIQVRKNHNTALVGESGCGKTTLGKAIMGLERVYDGRIKYNNEPIAKTGETIPKRLRRKIQIVFQDPYSSLNPRMRVEDIIGEGIKTHKLAKSKADYHDQIRRLLNSVGLNEDARNRYPHEFSGGQRQRICIARALAVNPKCLICDEATSALDVSVQAQILNLLKQLQGKFGLSYLFITHDLSVVEYFADYIYVMYLGKIVEEGPARKIFETPHHPYTRALLESAPDVTKGRAKTRTPLKGKTPSASNPPEGCRFHPRCPHTTDLCQTTPPEKRSIDGCGVWCHFPRNRPLK